MNSFRTAQWTHHVPITNTNCLTMFRDGSQFVRIIRHCGATAELPVLKQILHSDSTSVGVWRRVAEVFQTLFPRMQWQWQKTWTLYKTLYEASNIAASTLLGNELDHTGFESRQSQWIFTFFQNVNTGCVGARTALFDGHRLRYPEERAARGVKLTTLHLWCVRCPGYEQVEPYLLHAVCLRGVDSDNFSFFICL